ncbi:uncharacterized protein PITG_17743 [Phytophthora infestans T30-4]|uniref:Uncharacterized protein n=1 Tax=Phytophthora infestans (strain T30-4) TaxID=403677 RepID=D0NWB8_PHYIT|nr:uncharacterized protein PITG_17743 [Phytophthora infestans T30-4]EEY66969.1 hypothetical protein PITG_17743 [Phytophthora infestans T30-4]|eukprot:XP_002896599.1 hypothetical protein PITG_17743 [Phytophthora infestans T30-4]
MPNDILNIVSFISPPRLAAPVPEAWFSGSVTPVVQGGVTASPCGQGDQAQGTPRVANNDYTRQSATIQHVPQSSAATTADSSKHECANDGCYSRNGPVDAEADIAIGVAAGPANIHALAAVTRCTTETRESPREIATTRGGNVFDDSPRGHRSSDSERSAVHRHQPSSRRDANVHRHQTLEEPRDSRALRSRDYYYRESADIHAAGPMMTTILGEHR